MAAAAGALTFSASLCLPSAAVIPSGSAGAIPYSAKNRRTFHKGASLRVSARFERPLEEVYNVRVERGVSKERLEELGVERWSTWKTGRCRMPWDWHVDQQVYVVKGEVRVVPEGAVRDDDTGGGGGHQWYLRFVAGDLVRYPKWFEADLFFDGPYEERYRFRAYGDD